MSLIFSEKNSNDLILNEIKSNKTTETNSCYTLSQS
jgi:hypothetical protein